LAGGALGVLPIGAASKEHGYHLPLSTDFLQAEWLVQELLGRCNVLVWPTLAYGYYPVFVDYPGSTSLARETFIATVGEVLDGIGRAGARRAVVLNTGISTIEPLEAVLAAIPEQPKVGLINVYDGPAFSAAASALAEQDWGGHADEIETSIMLAIAPERVDMSRAEPALMHIERGLFNRSDPALGNYSPSGVNGDPTLASRDKGLRLAQAMLDDVTTSVKSFASDADPCR